MSWYQKAAVIASLFPKRFRITNGAGADVAVLGTAPTGSEDGLVVRNIPSGIQQVQITNQMPGTPLNLYNAVSAVPVAGVETIISYTAPAGHSTTLYKVDVGGENIARYDIIVNGDIVATSRTYFGSPLTATIDFSSAGYPLNVGDVVVVQVTNYRPAIANFESRIQLLQM